MNHRNLHAVVLSLAILAGAGTTLGQSTSAGERAVTKTSFQKDMRKLWEDHITWTRLYIVSALADLPDKNATANRLLQNQTDIGNAVKPFYGDAAGGKLTQLLKDHILVAADLIAGAKAGDTARSNRATAQWGANADSIAAFLSAANPQHWPARDMRSMMHEHLASTTQEVVARLKKDWEGDVLAYEKVHGQILEMADMLSSGLISQFPKKFR